MDVHIHDLDFVACVMGQPAEVRSSGICDPGMGGWSHISSQLIFADDSRALVQAGWRFPETFPFTMGYRIVCETGVLEWSFRAGKLLEQREAESYLVTYRKDGWVEREPADATDAFLQEWRYFLGCLEKKEEIANSTF